MSYLSQAAASGEKEPRTERGRKTLRRLLEAAAAEFGERGYHEAAINGITVRRGAGAGADRGRRAGRGGRRDAGLGPHRDERVPRHALRPVARGHGAGGCRGRRDRPGLRRPEDQVIALGGDLPDLIARRADLTPDAVALEEAAGGRVLSYAELDRRAGCAASVLADRGVGEGDRVAILCRNRIAFWELLFACA